jgi:hypothetical protein
MKQVRWNLVKNKRLRQTRGVSFEKLIQSKLVAVKHHPKKPLQDIMLFDHKGYIWVVPFVSNDEEIFLKTLYPSRKYTKLYKQGAL